MARNAEVVRQWRILLELEASRRGTINGLARKCGVTTRTIRRDLDALQEAGFPLFDERVDGKVFWKLAANRLRGPAETGFTLPELCAFYISCTVLECLAGAPFGADLKTAFDKLAGVLNPRMREFLDKLPTVLAAKEEPRKLRDTTAQKAWVSKLVDATLSHRRVQMRYHSFSSGQVKDYLVEPYRLAYGQGALYLFAFVPAYGQMRTFGVERIEKLSVLEERFNPVQEVSDKPFPDSFGVYSGKPEAVEIQFAAEVAPYIREREWRETQKIRELPDGSLVLSLRVCADRALQSWVMSFGSFARVLKPSALARRVLDESERVREHYAQLLKLDAPQ